MTGFVDVMIPHTAIVPRCEKFTMVREWPRFWKRRQIFETTHDLIPGCAPGEMYKIAQTGENIVVTRDHLIRGFGALKPRRLLYGDAAIRLNRNAWIGET